MAMVHCAASSVAQQMEKHKDVGIYTLFFSLPFAYHHYHLFPEGISTKTKLLPYTIISGQTSHRLQYRVLNDSSLIEDRMALKPRTVELRSTDNICSICVDNRVDVICKVDCTYGYPATNLLPFHRSH